MYDGSHVVFETPALAGNEGIALSDKRPSNFFSLPFLNGARDVTERLDAILHFDHLPPSPFLHERFGIKPYTFFLETPDNIKLRVVKFEPRCMPFCTTLIVPGQNDPIENHARLAFALVQSGARVFVYDPRSQGFSSRTAGLQRIDTLHKFDHLHDLRLVVDKVVRPYVSDSRTGRLVVAGFSMGGLHALVGLALHNFWADYAVAVAPAIKPFDLPLESFEAIYTSLWVQNTRNINGREHIRPPEGWDFSRSPLSEPFYRDNPYTDDRQQLFAAWQNMQLKGDMQRYGWPTKRRVADMYGMRRTVLGIPVGAITTPLQLVLAEYDGVVCNLAAKRFCDQTVSDLRGITELPVRHAVNLSHKEHLLRLVDVMMDNKPKRSPWKKHPMVSEPSSSLLH